MYEPLKFNSNVNLTSFLLAVPNFLSLCVLYQQKIQIEAQQKLIEKMTYEIFELRKNLLDFENNLTFLQNEIPVVPEKMDLNNPVILRFILALLIGLLSWHVFTILQAKWLGFSFYALLPKISIPSFLPFTKTASFFEVLLGDYTIRVSLADDKVTSILCKALNQMEYLPLERYLSQDPKVAEGISSAISSLNYRVTNALLDPSTVDTTVKVFKTVESVFDIL